MTNAAITKELEELRAQVADLTRAREGKAPEQQTEAVGSSVQAAVNTPQKRSVDVSEEDEGNEDELSFQIQELVDALEEEIKDTNPMTMLVVFAFGILIGRFLPR
ncbi:MAG: hypothetical protein JRC69_02435 [Deltaproteobacteria bacterium]|nr:hypothetical protein [Deltaproteobacteria bacterium]